MTQLARFILVVLKEVVKTHDLPFTIFHFSFVIATAASGSVMAAS
jgi:hypothetical protein